MMLGVMLVMLGVMLVVGAPLEVSAQESGASTHRTPRSSPPSAPTASSLGREPDLVSMGIGGAALGVGAVFGPLVNGTLTLGAYLEGTREPCLPGLCGIAAAALISLVPLVGPAIWTGLLLESPPPDLAGHITLAVLETILQHAGLAMMIIGGVVGRPTRPRAEGFVRLGTVGVHGFF